MFEYRTFLKLYGFLICINVAFLMINSGLGITSQVPTATGAQNVTSVDTPNFFNGTDNSNTITGNMTSPSQTFQNSTSPINFDWFVDYVEISVGFLQYAWLLISGSFLNDFISALSFPQYFVQGFYVIVGLLAFIWGLYIVTGKG